MAASAPVKRLFNQIMLGKVVDSYSPLKETIRVFIPHMVRSEKYNMYHKINEEVFVHDPKEVAKPGDIVLVKELPQRLSLKVNHGLVNIVYQSGNIIDPITGKKCFQDKYISDMEEIGEFMGQKPRYKIENSSKPKITDTDTDETPKKQLE